MRDVQRPLTGELKMVCHIYGTGRMEVYVLHLPSLKSSFGNKLLTKFGLTLTDEELLDADWARLLERAAGGAAMGL